MTNTIDQDRKEFEAWIKKYNQETQMTIRADGEYLLPEYQYYWEGWQMASAQLQRERQAQPTPSQSVVDENAEHDEDLPIREQYAIWYETCTNEDIFNLWQARAKLAEQPTSQASAQEHVAVYGSKRLTPEGTSEFWGFQLVDSIPNKAKLYTAAPQPQTVKDALEHAAKECEEWAQAVEKVGTHKHVEGEIFAYKNAACAIRALIQTER